MVMGCWLLAAAQSRASAIFLCWSLRLVRGCWLLAGLWPVAWGWWLAGCWPGPGPGPDCHQPDSASLWLMALYYTIYCIMAANLRQVPGVAVGVGWWLVGCWLLAAGCNFCHLQFLPSAICNLPSCLRWLAVAVTLACQPSPQPVNPASVTYFFSIAITMLS
jgi:hypothetical protein